MNDAQRLQAAPGQAFDWVAQEFIFPDDAARQALRNTWLEHANVGLDKLARELRKAWAPGVHWSSGEAYAHSQGWLPAEECSKDSKHHGDDPPGLLANRLLRVAHRIYRDPQVRDLIDPGSPNRWAQCTHVCINQDHFHDEERNVCGIRKASLISIEAGLRFLQQPAHKHPACDCTADPYPV